MLVNGQIKDCRVFCIGIERGIGEDTADLFLTEGVHLFKSVNLRGWPFFYGSISALESVRT